MPPLPHTSLWRGVWLPSSATELSAKHVNTDGCKRNWTKKVHKTFLIWPSKSSIMWKAILYISVYHTWCHLFQEMLYYLINKKLISSAVMVLMPVPQASMVITWRACIKCLIFKFTFYLHNICVWYVLNSLHVPYKNPQNTWISLLVATEQVSIITDFLELDINVLQ
jgi:hypothetical protein